MSASVARVLTKYITKGERAMTIYLTDIEIIEALAFVENYVNID